MIIAYFKQSPVGRLLQIEAVDDGFDSVACRHHSSEDNGGICTSVFDVDSRGDLS